MHGEEKRREEKAENEGYILLHVRDGEILLL